MNNNATVNAASALRVKNYIINLKLLTLITGLFGHTAVYHGGSKALYVYGGYEYQTDKTVISDNLYALDITSQKWSVLSVAQNKVKHLMD